MEVDTLGDRTIPDCGGVGFDPNLEGCVGHGEATKGEAHQAGSNGEGGLARIATQELCRFWSECWCGFDV